VSKTSRPALGTTQSTVQLLPGPLSPGPKQSRREAPRKNELSDISTTIYALMGTAVAQWLRCCATNRKVAGSIPAGVIDIKSFRSRYGSGVDSASNEYQEHFLGKDGRCLRLTTLLPSCAVVMKSGNLNFLGPSGPL